MNRGNAQVMTAQAVTGTNKYTSLVTSARRADRGSYVIKWTGTPTGTLAVEASNDPDNVTDANATWSAVPMSGSGAPVGIAGDTVIHMQWIAFARIRLAYTNSSGSGTMSAWLEIK